jgi:hypothetical protein
MQLSVAVTAMSALSETLNTALMTSMSHVKNQELAAKVQHDLGKQ